MSSHWKHFARQLGRAASSIMPWACLALALGGAPAMSAQREPMRFHLSIVDLSGREHGPIYYLEKPPGDPQAKLEPKRANVSSYNKSGGDDIQMGSTVTLYAGPESASMEELKPALQVPVKPGQPGQRLLLLMYLDDQGKVRHQFLDDTAAVHPAGEVRFLNALSQPVAFMVGGEPIPVKAGGETLATPLLDSRGRFPFKCVTQEDVGIFKRLRPRAYSMGSADERLLIVYAMSEEASTAIRDSASPEDPVKLTLLPRAYRIRDRSPGGATRFQGDIRPSALGSTARADEAGETGEPAGQKLTLTLVDLGRNQRMRAQARSDGQWQDIMMLDGVGRGAALAGGDGKVSFMKSGKRIGPVEVDPENPEPSLFVVVPTGQGDALIRFDNDEDAHPKGKVRLLNLTAVPLAYSIKDQVRQLAPAGAQVLELPDGDSYPFKVAAQTGGGWTKVEEAERTSPTGDERRLLIVYEVSPGVYSVREKEI